MNSTKHYAVNWNNHMNHVRKAFDNLLTSNELVDVTLYAEGQRVGAHKMLLSACSTYFRDLFREFPENHPIIVLKGVKFSILSDLLKFVYNGEVSIDSEAFNSFLETAEFLQISGLTGGDKMANTKFKNNEKDPEDKKYDVKTENDTCIESTEEPLEIQEHAEPDIPESKKRKNEHVEVKDEPPEKTVCHEDFNYYPLQLEPELPSDLLLQATGSNPSVTEESLKRMTEESLKIEYATTSELGDPVNFTGHSFQCSECERVFKNPFSLQQHLAVHRGNTQCHICQQVLSRKYHLKMHLFTRHNIK